MWSATVDKRYTCLIVCGEFIHKESLLLFVLNRVLFHV